MRFADGEIEGNLEVARAGPGVAQDQNGQTVHGEAPDHSKGIEIGQEGHVAVADEDGDDLQRDDDVDDAVAGAEARVRLAEPGAENAIFGNAVQYAVGADDGGVHRARQNNGADNYYEAVKDQSYDERAFEAHGQAAN